MIVYVTLRIDKMALLSTFDEELESLIQNENPIIITGDLNIDILKSNKLTKDYLCTLAGISFHLTINAPTQVVAFTSSCIDHNIVKNIGEVIVKTLDDCFTDHFQLFLDFSILGNVEGTEKNTEIFPFWSVLKNQLSTK